MDKNQFHLKEVLFEFVIEGNFVKVSAVDPVTCTEISIVGDRRTSKSTLEKIATRKLIWVLKRKSKKQKNQGAKRHNLI